MANLLHNIDAALSAHINAAPEFDTYWYENVETELTHTTDAYEHMDPNAFDVDAIPCDYCPDASEYNDADNAYCAVHYQEVAMDNRALLATY